MASLIGVEVAVGALGLAKGHVDIKRHPGVWDIAVLQVRSDNMASVIARARPAVPLNFGYY
jgi:hypothetical protein